MHQFCQGDGIMRNRIVGGILGAAMLAVAVVYPGAPGHSQSKLSPGYAAGDAGYSASERAGREIWFYATAFNDRFFTYSYPQRLGATIDWFSIFGAKYKKNLFERWGAIPNPDCCVPGAKDCPAKTPDETYGFQWCPGDTELLKFVGKTGYRDPACDFTDGPFNTATPHGSKDQRQSSCDLRFGTSTGVLGLRKFPNPRFDPKAWKKLNGSPASWDGYRKFLSTDKANPDSRMNRLFDGGIEPPFRIGMACGACHIAYDPLNPPVDASNPKWKNIKGLVGNQYSRISQLLGSGMSRHRLEWQLFGWSRPGVVDTSALPMDTVSNPGTMNAIINFSKRPLHDHRILKWRKASSCPAGADPAKCSCEAGKPGKCWERSEKVERVPNVLKGGEDSIGFNEAIQRVYFNIGSCAEQCWMNHIPDLRAVDSTQRNYGQTPFNIGQCRRDCASFRAVEDRLDDIAAFFMTARPTDLWKARSLASPRDLEVELDKEFGEGAVELGRKVFAQSCARCHSSQPGPYQNVDFRAVDPKDSTLRIDWLGNDKLTLASEIGTYTARALHSNHLKSRVWDQYASRTLKAKPADPNLKEIMKSGGRGYYRNISLLSVWAHAPFMHNNAIGPEICGKVSDPTDDFYASPYVDKDGKPLANAPACWRFDPSVKGRYDLYKASMEFLLNPAKRTPKMFLINRDIKIDVAPKVTIGDLTTGLTLKIPKGFPALAINSLRYKDLLQDVVLFNRDPEKLKAKYATILKPEQFSSLRSGLEKMRRKLLSKTGFMELDLTKVESSFVQRFYSNILNRIENRGHRFGEGLSDGEKKALIAFLATL